MQLHTLSAICEFHTDLLVLEPLQLKKNILLWVLNLVPLLVVLLSVILIVVVSFLLLLPRC